ncbi:MAG: DUF3795 domain-containing protein [Candidatus Bathyarchaeota archaeon]|nr:MAG: DUF3795 domain-containing protein [Candidatus Bathyarchaeota archaeon]
MSEKGEAPLLGICGVYCGACTTYRAYNDNDQALIEWEIKTCMPRDEIYCRGCLSDLVNEWCSNCDFRKCARVRGIVYCFECAEFPCKKLVDFSKTRAHRVLGLGNLKRLREISMEEWLREQEKRWACPTCGKKLHWYSEECPDCGTKVISATREAASLSQP